MATDNDSNNYIDWIEKAVTENYIKYYNYAEFTNMKEINHGSVGNIFQASWKGTDTLLVVKSSYKLSVKEIINEVFFINLSFNKKILKIKLF
jgi:hypothetical protein